MTDPADDPTEVQGPPPSAEPAVEQSLDAWAESTAEPTWTPIQVEGGAPGAGPAGPAPDQTVSAATSAGRSRRPSSLRSALDERIPNVPRRPLSPPPPPRRRVSAIRSGAAADQDPAPATPVPAGPPQPSLPMRLVALTEQRPEVGLGVAFFGGLLLATIIKRLGRR